MSAVFANFANRARSPRSFSLRLLLLFVCLLALILVSFFAVPPNSGRVSAQTAPTPTPTFTPTPLPTRPRGVPGDYWADIVIGQPDFNTIAPYTTVDNKLFEGEGAVVYNPPDPSTAPQSARKLFVYDAGNNRILGVDITSCMG